MRETERRRYAANQEAIKVASRCRYAAKKQAKLLSQKKDELSEALINPVTEYQNGLLTLTRRNDEGGDNTVPQFISESAWTIWNKQWYAQAQDR